MSRVVSATLLPVHEWLSSTEGDGTSHALDSPRTRLRFFVTEIATSLFFNIVLAALATWLLSDWERAASGRFADAFADLAPATIGPLLGFVVPITLGIRKRVRRGTVAPIAGARILPRNVVLRLLLLATIAPVVLAVPAAFLLAALAPQGGAFMAFKLGYGVAVALVFTPLVLVAALRDR